MVDVFDEVEEQLRGERYRSLASKSLPWVAAAVAAAVIGVGGYWGWDSYQTSQANKASEGYQAALEAAQKNGPSKAFDQFKVVADGGARGYKALALMQMGDIRIEENKTKEAIGYFDEAAKAAPDALMGDLARLKSAFALMDTASYKDIEARLTPLAERARTACTPRKPWRSRSCRRAIKPARAAISWSWPTRWTTPPRKSASAPRPPCR